MPRIGLDMDIGSDCDATVALALTLASPEGDLAADDAPRVVAHVRRRVGIAR
jgi:hypothetical protein